MFESIRRARLQREGLSCGKTRRKHQEGDLFDEMRTHPAGTVATYVLFFIPPGLSHVTKRMHIHGGFCFAWALWYMCIWACNAMGAGCLMTNAWWVKRASACGHARPASAKAHPPAF
jgi:hypothetical protein